MLRIDPKWGETAESLFRRAIEAPHKRLRERYLALALIALGEPAIKVAKKLGRSRETVEAWVEELSQIEAEGRKMETVSRLLDLEARMETLGEVRRTPEWKLMVERRRFLSRQEQNLRLLMETTRGLATAIAENNLKRVTGPISEIFRVLTQRSDFPSVLVDPARKYEVSLAGGDTTLAPTAILNLTDLNALAIKAGYKKPI